MADAFIVRRGGAASYNFKVVCSLTEPANPAENLVWITSDMNFTGLVLSSTEPADVQEGMVWITTGIASPGAFNAMKKGMLMVYPVFAKQYISGAWVQKIAKTYVNGEWKTWLWTHAYNKGDFCEALTGGWEALAIANESAYNRPNLPTITVNEDSVTIKQGNTQWFNGIYHTKNKVDLTPFSSISVLVSNVTGTTNASRGEMCLHTEYGAYGVDNRLASSSAWEKTSYLRTYTIDTTSINEPVYIGLRAYWGITYTVTELRLTV